MTHVFQNPRTAEARIHGGQPAYINVWQLDGVSDLKPGDAHWTREAADKAIAHSFRFSPFRFSPHTRCLYRVVVRPKVKTDD